MKKTTIFLIYYIFIIAVFTQCTTDSLSDLTTTEDIDIVKYSQNIKSIIDNNCISCHGAIPSNGAPNSLHTYELVRESVLNQNLIDRISRTEGTSGAMPQDGPRLPQNQINLVIQWNTDGLTE